MHFVTKYQYFKHLTLNKFEIKFRYSMNQIQNSTSSEGSASKTSVLHTSFDPTANNQGSVSYLQIVCLLVFAVQLVLFLLILKKHILKFVGFFILRKDYKNLLVLDLSEQNGYLNGNHQFSEGSNLVAPSDSNGPHKRIRDFLSRYKVKLMQQLHTYHPLVGLIFRNCNKNKVIRLPLHLTFWLILAIFLLTLTFSTIIAQLALSSCLDKRFYAANALACKTSEIKEMGFAQLILAAIFISLFCVAFTILGIFKFSKNYIGFLQKFSEFKSGNKNNEELESSPVSCKALEQKQHLPTLQNMLGGDSDDTTRSVRGGGLPHIGDFSNHKNKGLFQINEDDKDEECNSSRSNSEIKNAAYIGGDQKNQNSNLKITSKKSQRIDEPQNDKLNNSNFIDQMQHHNNSFSQKAIVIDSNKSQNSLQKTKTNGIFSDSTALIDGQYGQILSPPSIKHCGVEETKRDKVDLESSPNKDLKRFNDTQRTSMMQNNYSNEKNEISPVTQKSKKISIIKKIVLIFLVVSFVLGLLLDGYVLFNMTTNGLFELLTIFGLSVVIDLFIFRFIGILIISMVQVLQDIKQKRNPSIYYDNDHLEALGQIYKGYQVNQQQYIPLKSNSNNELDCPNSDSGSDGPLLKDKNSKSQAKKLITHQNEPTFGGLRFIKLIGPQDKKNPNRAPGEILLVEPTFFGQVNGKQKIQGQQQYNELNTSPQRSNQRRGEVMQGTSLYFNANQNGPNTSVNYGPNDEDFPNSKVSNQKNRRGQDLFPGDSLSMKRNQGLFNGEHPNDTSDLHDSKLIDKKSTKGQESSFQSSLPPLPGKKGLQQINYDANGDDSRKSNQNQSQKSLYPGQSFSYNHYGADSQGSPLQQDDFANQSNLHNQKFMQDVAHTSGTQYFQNSGLSNDHLGQNGFDEYVNSVSNPHKKRIFGKVMLPNGMALFNHPIFNGIWGKSNNNSNTDNTQYNRNNMKRTLGQVVNDGGNYEYQNFPQVVEDAENKLKMILTNNDAFQEVKKNSKGQILIVDSTQYNALPFMNLDEIRRQKLEQQKNFQNEQAQRKLQMDKLIKKSTGQEVVVNSSQNFIAPNLKIDQNKEQDLVELGKQIQKGKKATGEVVQIDSTSLFSLPMFQGDSKLTSEELKVKNQLMKLIGKKKYPPGSIISIESTKFYSLPMFTGKAELSPQMQNLQNQLVQTIKNKPSRDIIEIDSTYLFSLPMFQPKGQSQSKEVQEFKDQLLSLMGNKKPAPGEMVQIDSTQFYNLPIFQGEAKLSPLLQELQSQIQKSVKRKVTSGEVVQIDSTMLCNLSMFAENANLSPEAQEYKQLLFKALGQKRMANGEIVEIDSTQLFNLALFQNGKAQLSPELQELSRQFMSILKRKNANGEIVGVDAKYFFDLSNNLPPKGKFNKVSSSDVNEFKTQGTQRQLTKKKTNTGLIQGVAGQITFNASNQQVTKIMNQEKQLTQIDSTAEINELIGDGQRQHIEEELKIEDSKINSSFHLPSINIRSQQFETPKGLAKTQLKSKGTDDNNSSLNRAQYSVDEAAKNIEGLILQENDKGKGFEPFKNFEGDDKENTGQLNIALKLDGKNTNGSTIDKDQQSEQDLNKESFSPRYNSNSKKQKKVKKVRKQSGFSNKGAQSRKGSVNNENIVPNQEVLNKSQVSSKTGQKIKTAFAFEGSMLNLNESLDNQENIKGNRKESFNSPKEMRNEIQGKLENNKKFEISPIRQSVMPIQENNTLKESYKYDHGVQEFENTREKMNLKDFIKPKIPNGRKLNKKQTREVTNASIDMQEQSFDEILKKQTLQSLEQQTNLDDSSRNKLYEDSDKSTFRMISFKDPIVAKENAGPLNFYDQTSSPQEKKQQKTKVFEIVEETEELDTQHDLNQKRKSKQEVTKKNKKKGNVEILDSDNDIDALAQMMSGGQQNQNDIEKADIEAEINDFKFSKRKQIKMPKKKNNRKDSQGSDHSSIDSAGGNTNKNVAYDSQGMAEQLKQQKERKEVNQQRMQEQKRKLKHVLQLVLQQKPKSQSDENKINELLEIIATTKKPLPMSRIRELKELEMMASPYSQSLISMIKDEVEFHKKKKEEVNKNQRNGKSQQRSDQKSQNQIKKLGGIYGVAGPSIKKNGRDNSLKKDSSESSFGETSVKVKNAKTLKNEDKVIRGSKRGQIKARELNQSVNSINLQNQVEAKNMSSLAFNSSDDDFLSKPQSRGNQNGKNELIHVEGGQFNQIDDFFKE